MIRGWMFSFSFQVVVTTEMLCMLFFSPFFVWFVWLEFECVYEFFNYF